jgi:Family of unknown function (DUF5309)
MSTGIFNSGMIAQDLARKSFAGMITRLFPNGNTPLFGLTSMLSAETALQAEHGFFTKTMLFPQLTLGTGGQAATDTVFTVTSTVNIVPGMVMRADATGENILVIGIVSPVQVAVQRGLGSIAAQSITASTNLYQVGSAFEEGSLRPNALAINPVRITNLTQIFRNTWAITDSARATAVIAGDTNVAENRQDCAAFHAVDIEKAIFFGQKSAGTRNGQPFRTMDGIYSIVSNIAYYPSSYSATNVTVAGSTTNYTQFEAAFDPLFNQATDPKVANERVMFVGGTAKKVINNIGRLNGTYYMVDGQTSWGLQFTTIKIARGTFRVIEHPLFNTNASWSKLAIAIDLSSFNLAYLGDRKTQNREFNMDNTTVADNGIDAVGGTLTTELTTVVKNPPASGIMTNLTAAAVG